MPNFENHMTDNFVTLKKPFKNNDCNQSNLRGLISKIRLKCSGSILYINGSDSPSEASTVEGSSSKRYEVTGTLKFVTTNPDGVSIAVNGETVKPTDNGGNGIYTYVVDFSSILATWEEENKPTVEPDTPDDSGSAPSSETSSPE